MFGLGTPEIVVILIIALVLFGPKKLPEIGSAIGKGIREIRKASREVVDTFEGVVEDPTRSEEGHDNAPISGNRHE